MIRTGDRFGTYEILESLGTGGMGEVYRAREQELGRHVALKVLRDELAEDPELIARLEREARLLASLEHPRVARLYSYSEFEGKKFLAMELVDGESLSERLARGRLPVPEALSVCAQIAEGLDAAHLAGVIHRDLKPANVLLDADGDVRLADFGIARSVQPETTEASALPTSNENLTARGALLGTAPYMSPEQLRGRPVDARADIWALGCTLFECLTGSRPFAGDSPADTSSAILTREPDWSRLPSALPARARALLERMLRKDARERQRSAGDVWLELREILANGTSGEPAAVATPGRWARLGVLAMVALAAVVVVWILRPEGESSSAPARFELPLPADTRWSVGSYPALAISPDGGRVVFAAGGRLWSRRLDSLESLLIPGSDDARAPFFSPDGTQVGFFLLVGESPGTETARIVRVSLAHGGAPVPIVQLSTDYMGGVHWAEDGYLYFAARYWAAEQGVFRVREEGSEPERIITLAEGEFAREPTLLPGGEWLLFSLTTRYLASDQTVLPIWKEGGVVAQSLRTAVRRELAAGATSPRYATSGHLVYAADHNLFAVPYEPGAATVSGGAVSVLSGIHQALIEGTAQYDISRQGDLVYLPGGPALLGNSLIWIDRNGSEEPLPFEPTESRQFSLAPDASRVAINEFDASGDSSQLWIYDLERGDRSQLTSTGYNVEPHFSPDGVWVYFTRSAGLASEPSIWRRRADRSAPPELVLELSGLRGLEDISSDGKTLLFSRRVDEQLDVWSLSLEGEPSPQPLLSAPSPESSASLSPDGRWVAFNASEDRLLDAFVMEIATGRRYPVSTALLGGARPVWSSDGTRIFFYSSRRAPVTEACPFCDGPQLLEVDIRTEPEFAASVPRSIARASHAPFTDFDVTADGNRFLIIRRIPNPRATGPSDPMVVVLDWHEDLRRLTSGRR